MFQYDVGVIGIGRVGLPLALSFCNKGLNVLGFDINPAILKKVNNQEMPFHEDGYDELIKYVKFHATDEMERISHVENIIITVGTPLLNHIETDLSQIQKVLNSIYPYIKNNHNIILRSTVAPKTTDFVKKTIEKNTGLVIGQDIFLSFCPERILEGKAMKELEELPQLIGAEDHLSFEKSKNLFKHLTRDIIQTDFITAELTKLFNNISRYVYFALANELAIIAEDYEADIYKIIENANYKYPRPINAKPGFTAGTCLMKELGMINENIPYSDLLLSSWKINEFMPKFLLNSLKKRTVIYGKTVAILGYTFKQNSDDIRDSLIPKLYRYIQREVPEEIKIHDPFLSDQVSDQVNNISFVNYNINEAIENSQIIFLAINHSVFSDEFTQTLSKIKDEEAWIIDIWNIGKIGRLFYQKKDLNFS
jgi:UDP-N-acetyl-D-mannosaminuronic acid dehydrogenase